MPKRIPTERIAQAILVLRGQRGLLASNLDLAHRFAQLEARIDKKRSDHDEAINAILSAIRHLMNPPAAKRRGSGLTANLDRDK